MRANIRVAVQYIEHGFQEMAVPIYGLMEDAATAEIRGHQFGSGSVIANHYRTQQEVTKEVYLKRCWMKSCKVIQKELATIVSKWAIQRS